MLDGVRLDETSAAAVAMASWHDQLYLAWTGSDLHVNLASSPDGHEIMGKQWLDHRSPTTVSSGRVGTANVALAPSLAASGERLYLAWKGGDDSFINLLSATDSPRSVPVRLGEARSASAPAFCSHQDSLIVGRDGTDHHVNLARLQ
jgi:hypothetical protein